jgi:hypothetical protein
VGVFGPCHILVKAEREVVTEARYTEIGEEETVALLIREILKSM